jgi:type II secretory pathway component PulF
MFDFDFRSKIIRGESLSPQTQAIFLKKLDVMMGSGFSLQKALGILSMEGSSRFKNVLCDIKDQVTSGKNFSESLDGHPSLLSEPFQGVFENKEGEDLRKALPIMITHTEKKIGFPKGITECFLESSLPLFGVIILSFLASLAIHFDFGGDTSLSETTELILNSVYFLAGKGAYIMLVGIFLVLFLLLLARIKLVKIVIEEVIRRTPIISTLSAKINAVTINRHLSTLVSSGVPLSYALRMTADYKNNSYYKKLLNELADRVDDGEDFSSAFGLCSGLYPGAVMREIIGDKTPEVFDKLADMYETDVKNIAKSTFQIAEMFFAVFIIGGSVFSLLSVFQPMLID